jgi:aspartyl-tRNA(Asn)/glutamyl-tRNA(Gln) amidotransferase subunit A
LDSSLCNLGVFELGRLYRQEELSPVEVVDAHLDRCERLNPVLNSFLLILKEQAKETAQAVAALFRAGVDLGPLQGIPVSIKDLIQMRGTRTTGGSRVLLQEGPDQKNAIIVQRLLSAGAIIIGKTNLHEFASGDPDPAGPFGLVQNPRRLGHHPGSSSSGAGAAVAAGLGVIAIGTDTSGSVRIPAYFCGVAGLKPTKGRIELDGIIPLSWTLDSVGPLARRVRDVAAGFRACAGGTCRHLGFEDASGAALFRILDQPVQGWRIGIPKGEFFHQVQPVVSIAFENTLRVLGDLGCQLIEFDPPGVDLMQNLIMAIVQAEGSTYHERYRDRDPLYGDNFRERILVGREMKAVNYLAARERQIELQREWEEAVFGLDALAMPSGPAVAPPHGTTSIEINGKPLAFRPLSSSFTRPANLLGWPALTLPNGISEEGLPTGVQLMGRKDSEDRLLNLGHQLEQALGLVSKLGIEPSQKA